MPEYSIAFWNLENLFDIETWAERTEKLQRAIGKDLRGWTQQQLDRKIAQLASVITQMNGGRGPDLLGVAEVENAHVLGLLAGALAPLGRNYQLVHHDMSDLRGIDVAFLYDPAVFEFETSFSHFVMRRTATRDILQANLFTRLHRRRLVVLANHWPSRRGNEAHSAGYRAIAGETLAYFHKRILEVLGPSTPVLAMGDFNDEPSDPSLVEYALSLRSPTRVIKGRDPYLLNLMWPLMGQGEGSLYFDNLPNLFDQFLVNKNFLKGESHLKVVQGSAAILHPPAMVTPGDYPAPLPFGGMGKAVNQNGFSDHYPVTVRLTQEA